MKIFYLDTTTSNLNIALYSNGKIIFSYSEFLGNEMSIKVLSIIQELFKENRLKVSEIDKIIVANGPGSFTGIRIGLTIAKVLAWSLNIPIIVVSTIEVMALSYNKDKNYVIPIIDARRGFVYSGIYDIKHNKFYLKEQHINLEQLLVIAKSLESVDYISNDKFNIDLIKYVPNFLNIIEKAKNYKETNIHLVDANYLKLTEAEENLNS